MAALASLLAVHIGYPNPKQFPPNLFRWGRLHRSMWVPPRVRIASLDAARALFSDCFAWSDKDKEHLWIAHVDHDFWCVQLECIAGDASSAHVSVKDIVAAVIEHKSTGLLLAHNHPSGDPRPSDSDMRITRRLANALEGADCRLHEHLISAGSQWTSFRKMGLL